MLKNIPSIIKDESLYVFVDSLGESAVVLGIRGWVKTDEYWTTRWALLENIKLTFDEEGIVIPYNQLTVHVDENKEQDNIKFQETADKMTGADENEDKSDA